MSTFSYSKISAFQKCARSFEFRYVLGERERFSTIERHMGSSVHEALRWLYEERDAGRHPQRESLAACYDRHWNGPSLGGSIVVKERLSAADYHDDGLRMVLDFFDRAFGDDASRTLLLERRFSMKLDGKIRFTGIIDRAARSDGGRLRITDYKTGSRVADPASDPQLAYYALFLFGEHADDEIELAYEDLRQGRSLTAVLRRDDSDRFQRRLLEEIAVIESAVRYDPSPSILCRWCGFNPICDAAELPARRSATADDAGNGRICPQCRAPLRQRSGRFGSFVGCSGFPDCRYTRDGW